MFKEKDNKSRVSSHRFHADLSYSILKSSQQLCTSNKQQSVIDLIDFEFITNDGL